MKLRVTFLALSLMGMAVLVFLLLKPDEDGLAAVPPPPPPRVLPDPEPLPQAPETAEQQANRLKGLDPDLREAVLRIEDAMHSWEKQNPAAGPDAWGEFLLGEIDKLGTDQLLALVNAVLTNKAWGLPGKYYTWVYQAWGRREPAKARDCMVGTAEINGMLNGEGSSSNRSIRGWIQGNFEAVQIGHARRDPLAAWQQMKEDLADPRMQDLTGKFFAQYILEFYAKQDPQGSWREIDSRPDLAFYLVPGFAMGAPPGQDWEAQLDDYASLYRDANGREARADRAVNSLMARWLTEDPDAALAWVDLRLNLQDFVHFESFNRWNPAPQLPSLEDPSEDLLVELEMMRDIYIGFWNRHRLMKEILTSLIAKGHRELAALAIADRLGNWSWDPQMYPLIRSFPDPTLREGLLLTAVRKLPKHERNFSNREESRQHLALLYSLWTLSAEIDVPEEAKRLAQSRIRTAYAVEKSIFEKAQR